MTQEDAEINTKLSVLRIAAVEDLHHYLTLRQPGMVGDVDYAATRYVTSQAKYTMALVEAQQDSILDYVEIP